LRERTLDRRVIAPNLAVIIAADLEQAGFLTAWTERTGGVSEEPFRNLNLSFREDRAAAVRENRRRVARALGIPPFATARQVHGADVARVGPLHLGVGFSGPEKSAGRADALITSRRRTPLGVLTADCAPVVLASQEEGRLAAVHAGWRGVAAGILSRAVGGFASPRSVLAAIGPTIGPCHYEVGMEVVAELEKGMGGGVSIRDGDRLLLDLPGTVERELRRLGVPSIERAAECTACSPGRFFSHRREGRTGRQALIAMRL
jgi:YfiH family protein